MSRAVLFVQILGLSSQNLGHGARWTANGGVGSLTPVRMLHRIGGSGVEAHFWLQDVLHEPCPMIAFIARRGLVRPILL